MALVSARDEKKIEELEKENSAHLSQCNPQPIDLSRSKFRADERHKLSGHSDVICCLITLVNATNLGQFEVKKCLRSH